MKIKILGIGSDCISLFSDKPENFIGYIGKNMFYFDLNMLKKYNLYEKDLLDQFKPIVKTGGTKLNDILFFDLNLYNEKT